MDNQITTQIPHDKQSRSKSYFMIKFKAGLKHMKNDHQLLIIFLPCFIFYVLFRYGSMYGVIIAFKKYSIFLGIMDSPWVGLKYFEQFINSPDFFMLFKNTFLLGIYNLFWTFPLPVMFAVLLGEVKHKFFAKSIQTISYVPSFISVVILSGMVIDFLSPSRGIINNLIAALGGERTYFMIDPNSFRTVYISSGIWSGLGSGAIIYLAAVSGVDITLYEAGKIDGCNRFHAMWYITIPSILPTIATMFIINAGNMFKIGFEKVFLLYNPLTYGAADVFSTYVYRRGLIDANFSYATAVGLFESIICVATLVLTNKLSKKISGQGLW